MTRTAPRIPTRASHPSPPSACSHQTEKMCVRVCVCVCIWVCVSLCAHVCAFTPKAPLSTVQTLSSSRPAVSGVFYCRLVAAQSATPGSGAKLSAASARLGGEARADGPAPDADANPITSVLHSHPLVITHCW